MQTESQGDQMGSPGMWVVYSGELPWEAWVKTVIQLGKLRVIPKVVIHWLISVLSAK